MLTAEYFRDVFKNWLQIGNIAQLFIYKYGIFSCTFCLARISYQLLLNLFSLTPQISCPHNSQYTENIKYFLAIVLQAVSTVITNATFLQNHFKNQSYYMFPMCVSRYIQDASVSLLTTFSRDLSTPSLPKRTWNGEETYDPSACWIITTSIAPVNVAELMSR